MGGGNAQKSAAARAKKLLDTSKTPEERKAANAKAVLDSTAFKCGICMSTFMVNVKPPQLHLHVTSKHPAGTDPVACFAILKGYDPDDPKGLKAAAAAAEAAKSVVKKPKKKKDDGFEDLLSAGLTKGKKKKK
jgi:hypothetical protein